MYRAEPSSLYSTSRQCGYFLVITPSIQIGIEAIPIWMKYPAWSIVSVSGAVNTINLPPSADSVICRGCAWASDLPFVIGEFSCRDEGALGHFLKQSRIRDRDLRQKYYLFFDEPLTFNNANASPLTVSQAKDFGSTISKCPAFSITTSFASSPFFLAASAYSFAISSGMMVSLAPCTIAEGTPSGSS